jgi:hypothetical protein
VTLDPNTRYTNGDRDEEATRARTIYNKRNERARIKSGPQLVPSAPVAAAIRYAVQAGIEANDISDRAGVGREHTRRMLNGHFPMMRRVRHKRLLDALQALVNERQEALDDCRSAIAVARGTRDSRAATWPVEPLMERIRGTYGDLGVLPNSSMRQHLHRSEFLSTSTADRYAVELGWLPEEIWSDWFSEVSVQRFGVSVEDTAESEQTAGREINEGAA